MKASYIEVNGCKVGAGFPVYIVAELSANHRQQFDEAVKLLMWPPISSPEFSK